MISFFNAMLPIVITMHAAFSKVPFNYYLITFNPTPTPQGHLKYYTLITPFTNVAHHTYALSLVRNYDWTDDIYMNILISGG